MNKILSENDLKKISFSIKGIEGKKEFLVFGFLKDYNNQEAYNYDSWLSGNLFDLLPKNKNFNLNQVICGCIVDAEKENCHDLYVIPVMRGNGVATQMYSFIEQYLNIDLKPSNNQTDMGKVFWEHYKRNKSRKFTI